MIALNSVQCPKNRAVKGVAWEPDIPLNIFGINMSRMDGMIVCAKLNSAAVPKRKSAFGR